MDVPERQHFHGRRDAAPNMSKAADWVQKALNPAHGILGPVAIPDTAASVTATGEWRANWNLAPPQGQTTALWDCDIVAPLSGLMPMVYRFYPSGQQPAPMSGWISQSYPFSPTGDFAPLTQAVEQYRTSYASLTLYFNAPALADQGRIVVGQIPNLMRTVNQTAAQLDPAAAARRIFEAIRGGREADYVDAVRANALTQTVVVQDFPPVTEAELTQFSPTTYVGLAKDGAYVPFKFIQPTHNYVEVIPNLGNLQWALPDGSWQTVIPGTKGWQVVGGLNTQTAVILLRGMATTSTLFIKCRQGFEAVSAPNSVLAAFQFQSAVVDQEALLAVAAAQQLTPAAYPARDNDFLGVLKSIGRALTGRVAQGIGKVLASSGIPVVSQIAGPAVGVMKAANKLL